jgi:hypothetical protein
VKANRRRGGGAPWGSSRGAVRGRAAPPSGKLAGRRASRFQTNEGRGREQGAARDFPVGCGSSEWRSEMKVERRRGALPRYFASQRLISSIVPGRPSASPPCADAEKRVTTPPAAYETWRNQPALSPALVGLVVDIEDRLRSLDHLEAERVRHDRPGLVLREVRLRAHQVDNLRPGRRSDDDLRVGIVLERVAIHAARRYAAADSGQRENEREEESGAGAWKRFEFQGIAPGVARGIASSVS